MKNITAFFLEVALLCLTAAAQTRDGAIEGKISDPSGAAVSRATVSLTSRDTNIRVSTTSAEDGHYRFAALTPGEYLIDGKAAGLGSSGARTVRVGAGETVQTQLGLELDRVNTQVQVTASGTAQTTDEETRVIDVVDSEQLDRRATASLADSIRFLPGMHVSQLGGPGALVRVISRGLRAQDTSLLIDGFRLRDTGATQGDATSYLADLSIIDTDRIEVLRGAASTLYGTNATGAVVNLVTDHGGGAMHGDIAAEGGGLGTMRGIAHLAGGAMENRLQFTAGVSHMNVMSGIDGDDRYRNTGGQGFLQYTIAPGSVLSGRVFAADMFTQLNVTPVAIGASALPRTGAIPAIAGVNFKPSLDDPDSRRASHYFTGLLAFTQRIAPGASVRVSYQGLATSRDNRDGPGGSGFQSPFNTSSIFNGRLDTLQARADVQLTRSNLLTGGYEFEREHFDNPSSDENPILSERAISRVQVTQNSHALFLQDQARFFNDRLLVSASGRYQNFQLSVPVLEGGTSLYTGMKPPSAPSSYTGDGAMAYSFPKQGTKIRAHVGNGFRSPSLYERYGTSYYLGSFSNYGDPRLSPERMISVDGGIDQYLLGGRLRLRGTYFYTRIQQAIMFDSSGVITPATDPFGRFGGYRNTGGGLARGFEGGVDAMVNKTLTVNGTYTYTNALERTTSLISGTLRSPRVFEHMFTAGAVQRIGRRTDVTFNLLAASNYMYPISSGGSRAFLFKGPLKADVTANYTLPVSEHRNIRFYMRAENILDRTRYEDGFITPGFWAVGGLKFLF